jgi:hypothetical protein
MLRHEPVVETGTISPSMELPEDHEDRADVDASCTSSSNPDDEKASEIDSCRDVSMADQSADEIMVSSSGSDQDEDPEFAAEEKLMQEQEYTWINDFEYLKQARFDTDANDIKSIPADATDNEIRAATMLFVLRQLDVMLATGTRVDEWKRMDHDSWSVQSQHNRRSPKA